MAEAEVGQTRPGSYLRRVIYDREGGELAVQGPGEAFAYYAADEAGVNVSNPRAVPPIGETALGRLTFPWGVIGRVVETWVGVPERYGEDGEWEPVVE